MAEHPLLSSKWLQRFRWGWLAIALWGLISTPFALISAYYTVMEDHRMIFPMVLAFTIRIAMICWFFSLWLKYRPIKSEKDSEPPQQLLNDR
jgi:hypothetical protein